MSRLARALVAAVLGLSVSPWNAQASMPAAVALAPAGDEQPVSSTPDHRPQRASESDQPDGVSGAQTHLIYFVPKSGDDRALDTDGTITASFASILDWFRGQMGKRPRLDRLQGASTLDISFVAGAQEAASYTSLRAIASELQTKGFDHADKRYFVYAELDRGNVCGEGSYPLPTVEDSGRFAALYLRSNNTCGATDIGSAGKAETTIVQEWLHMEGLASPLSPHHCLTAPYHVCTGPLWLTPELDPESSDVLFPIVTDKLSAKVLDRDRDDYLDHPLQDVAPDLRDSIWLEN